MLKTTLGMGHGDANTVVHTVRKPDGRSEASATNRSPEQVLDGLYTGPKEALRRIHDKLIRTCPNFTKLYKVDILRREDVTRFPLSPIRVRTRRTGQSDWPARRTEACQWNNIRTKK